MTETPAWAIQALGKIAADPNYSDFFDDNFLPSKDVNTRIVSSTGLIIPTEPEFMAHLARIGINLSAQDGLYRFETRIGQTERKRAVMYSMETDTSATTIYESGINWRPNLTTQTEHFARRTILKHGEPAGLAEVLRVSTFNTPLRGRFLNLQVGILAYPFLAGISYQLGNDFSLSGIALSIENLEDLRGQLTDGTTSYPLLINDWAWLKNSTNKSERDFLTLVFGQGEFLYSVSGTPFVAADSQDRWPRGKYNVPTALPNSDRSFSVEANAIEVLRKDLDVKLMDHKRGIDDPFVRVNAGSRTVAHDIVHDLQHVTTETVKGFFDRLPLQAIIKANSLGIDFSLNTGNF